MGYYDRWSLAHAAVTTTALNARIAMTPNGQLWREITPADLPPPIKDPCKIVLST